MKFAITFLKTNAAAYAKASKVFAAIESQGFTETLAAAGVAGPDIKVFATVWVAEQSKVTPHDYRGAWVFTKDSTEHSRVKYLVAVASGAAEAKAAARKGKAKSSGKQEADLLTAALAAYGLLTAAQKRAFKAAI
jgi:hypothetical protein